MSAAPITDEDGNTLLPLTEEHLEGAIACLTKVWVRDNLIARAFEVSEEEYRPVAQGTCERAARDGLGAIAVDAQGEVIAFTLWIDLLDELEQLAGHESVESRKMRRWSRFLHRMMWAYLGEDHGGLYRGEPRHGEVLYADLGGALPEHQAKGLVARLSLYFVMTVAIPRGYRRMIGVATNPNSLKLSRRQGCRLEQPMTFADFGIEELLRVEGLDAPAIVIRDLA